MQEDGAWTVWQNFESAFLYVQSETLFLLVGADVDVELKAGFFVEKGEGKGTVAGLQVASLLVVEFAAPDCKRLINLGI